MHHGAAEATEAAEKEGDDKDRQTTGHRSGQLHWATWIALLVVGTALIRCQFVRRYWWAFQWDVDLGWPLLAVPCDSWEGFTDPMSPPCKNCIPVLQPRWSTFLPSS